jgi:hypothetical protein
MGKLLDRLTSQLKEQGYKDPKGSAIAFLRKQGSMKQDSLDLTEKGKQRESMSASERAIDRASRISGRDPEDYEYNPKTNKATLKYGYS